MAGNAVRDRGCSPRATTTRSTRPPEPIAYAGTDRNFYDRYFFNGYSAKAGDKAFFAAAFGVYPHLNIADAAFVVVRDGVEIALHASRHLGHGADGPAPSGRSAIEVVEPLQRCCA